MAEKSLEDIKTKWKWIYDFFRIENIIMMIFIAFALLWLISFILGKDIKLGTEITLLLYGVAVYAALILIDALGLAAWGKSRRALFLWIVVYVLIIAFTYYFKTWFPQIFAVALP